MASFTQTIISKHSGKRRNGNGNRFSSPQHLLNSNAIAFKEKSKSKPNQIKSRKRKKEMVFGSHHHQLLLEANRARIWSGAFLLCIFFFFATPKIPHSPKHHLFADMRNFFGVPNTLNVITNFPLLVVGVLGLVLCLHGNYFGISLRGEMWGWVLFYAAMAGAAFGSAYYHLKPDDARVLWDRLPIMIAVNSLFSCLIIERVNERIGVTCLVFLLIFVLVSIAYEGIFNDLRLCMMLYFIPCVIIPLMAFVLPPKYTHSTYWFLASGFYLLAKFEALADKKIYVVNHYIISGHSLEHLCLVMVPVMLTIMLWYRNIRIPRCNRRSGEPMNNVVRLYYKEY